jgi:hypothetical protein
MRYKKKTQRIVLPGEPEKRERAGTTVLGARTVLSAILAQSLMMVNLPYERIEK